MLQFLDNLGWDVVSGIIAIVIFAIFIFALIYFGKLKEARKIIYALVVEAEKKFGSGQGDLKYTMVVGEIYPRLPSVVRLFVTEKMIDFMIEEAVEQLKNYFTENPEQTKKFYGQ